MEIVLALGSAFAYGVSDFTGGVLSKRANVLTVVLVSQLISTAIALFVLPFWGGAFSWPALGWGAAAGAAGMAGAACLYRGLAIGRMGVVAPITAVLSAAIPVAFGLVTEQRPDAIALTGVGIGLAAVVLISRAPEPASDTRATHSAPAVSGNSGGQGIAEAFGAGLAFGLFFILLDNSPGGSGIWPIVGTRLSEVLCAAILVVITGAPIRAPNGTSTGLVLLGFSNLGADLLYLLATRRGLLSLVAVITSFYPAATVALARIVLKERMVRQQSFGVAFAALSVTLIALG
jgi:drug/metabolite transporter (DMT)-like permease